ncbi:MAG: membrane dipeptidase [Candidatus Aminicenantes bacterium]|nr:membrane dipeptidase [Candidatus Aminicenantes bacterium]
MALIIEIMQFHFIYARRKKVHQIPKNLNGWRCFACLLILIALPASGENAVDKLHREAVVWDCHNDLAYRVLYEGLDIGKRLPAGHVDIPRLKEGGVDVQVVALFIQNYLYPDKAARQAFQLLEAMKKAIDRNRDSVELARTGADVERIVSSGKIAIPLAIEGGHAIEDRLDLLRKFHELGVSSMTLTHNISHGWADSSAGTPRWNGLNDLGREVIREMNRLGMVIDVSHVSDKAFFDVIEISREPVIFSHSGCRAINPHRRNVSDEMLRALAKNGGVIGIVFELTFLSQRYHQAAQELRAISRPFFEKVPVIEDLDLRIAVEHLSQGRDWPLEDLPTVEDILDHIDHAVRVAGVDHVGLGADMYPRTPSPLGVRGVHDYPNITRGLKARGYSDEDVKKIMGGNFLRVWKQVTNKKR